MVAMDNPEHDARGRDDRPLAGRLSTSLVLGSGGARGMTHIGVIRCLEDRGYRIRCVAGSSIGALIGGIYAAGKLDVYAEWVSALQKGDIVRLLDWSFDDGALFKGERIIDVLKQLIGDRSIEDLAIPYTAVATDLSQAGGSREVWLDRGPLFDAIRASIAVPGVFSPARYDGRLLVDGGIVNPVPVGPTLKQRTVLTVAVDLNGVSDPDHTREPPRDAAPGARQLARRQSIRRYLDRLWPAEPARPEADRLGFAHLLTRSMEAMQATITQFELAATMPSFVVSIPRNVCGFFDFHRAKELIEYGYTRTEQALDHARSH